MRPLVLSVALLSAAPAQAYYGTGYAEFAWGATPDRAWVTSGAQSLQAVGNDAYFSALGGYNGSNMYNTDFAGAGGCGAIIPPTATLQSTRKYGCRYVTSAGDVLFTSNAVADAGPAVRATGSFTVTDTTLTGTLTVLSSTDEPTGATTTFSASGVRLSNSVGDGASGYNLRTNDGSPFGNAWHGVSTLGTLEFSFTGVFTDQDWQVTGGTARFTDTGFACQQGGFSAPSDILCAPSRVAGGFQSNGAHLSWGWDLDGALTGTSAVSEIEVRDATGANVLGSIAGARAVTQLRQSIPYEPQTGYAGIEIHGLAGEFRRALGSAGAGCSASLRWDGSKLTCGTLTAGRFGACFAKTTADPLPPGAPNCAGIAADLAVGPVPLPGAAWFAPALLGAVPFLRRRARGPTADVRAR